MVARDPAGWAAFHPDGNASLGIRHDLGPVALTATAERGKVASQLLRAGQGQPRYNIGAVALDGKIGPASLSLGLSRLRERETILGGRFSDALTRGGSISYFADGSMKMLLGGGWTGSASYRLGRTDMSATGSLATGGRLWSEGFAFDLSKTNALAGGDMLSFRVAQPLRVRSGGYDLRCPSLTIMRPATSAMKTASCLSPLLAGK